VRLRPWLAVLAATGAVLAVGTAPATAIAPTAKAAAAPVAAPPPNPAALARPDTVLPRNWRSGTDRAVTVSSDANGLHLLVADESTGYAWRTAATLADDNLDADQWIGNACVTGSGRRAVAIFAPRTFTNSESGLDAGGLVAVVDLNTGTVNRLTIRASLAYFNPGCGTGETAAVTTFDAKGMSRLQLIDASTATVTSVPAVAGELTSVIPVGSTLVGALGQKLVSISTTGAVRTLSQEKGMPFRLQADRTGGIAYEVASGSQAEVRRFAGRTSALLGTASLTRVQLTSSGGHVFVLGPDRGKIKTAGLTGWQAMNAPLNTRMSTGGMLAVTGTSRTGNQAKPDFDRADPVAITATITSSQQPAQFQVQPLAGKTNHVPRPATIRTMAAVTRTASPASLSAADPGRPPQNDPTDPDRACAMARNDSGQETYQATADQVEWAVDLAVHGHLTISRPQNWLGSGSDPYQIQGPNGMFPLHALVTGGTVPAQVLLGILAQESNTMQASPHLVDGEAGNVNQGGFYGDGTDWSTVDCGYGVGQVTTGMAVADGNFPFSPAQQKAIATDYAANIAASLDLLIDKWNLLYSQGIIANDGKDQYIENWYLAAWDYNTGMQPNANNGNTTGCTPSPNCDDGAGHWGLGWFNNPANPRYPYDRPQFDGHIDDDTKNPQNWPYQEKVIGWAYKPVMRYDYLQSAWRQAYVAVLPPSGGVNLLPPFGTFCVENLNDCQPGIALDKNGNRGAGLCNEVELHCWWHWSVNWLPSGPTCLQNNCGVEQLNYAATDPEPGRPDVYPAVCNLNGLPAGAHVIDAADPDPVGNCPVTTDGGTFGWTFAATPASPSCGSTCITYQSKIDFHQIGGSGFGGHFWFSHTVSPNQENLAVTGTWTLNPPNAWTRLFVHIPVVGAQTHQAKYQITLPNGGHEFRVITTPYEKDTWVDLGVYDMTGTNNPVVSLSNITDDGAGWQDIAWDALAYQALAAKPAHFVVALGDSYSSGEGTGDYYHQTDQDGADPDRREACRRSDHAWARQVTLKGMTQTIGQLADSEDPSMSFAFAACSGARTYNVASKHLPWNPYSADANGDADPHDIYGELPQLDQGLLDDNTTDVLLTIGGNDAGFSDTLIACAEGPCPSEQSLDDNLNNTVAPRVQEVVAEIRAQAKYARIIVAGYPELFNPDSDLQSCGALDPQVVCLILQNLNLSLSKDKTDMLNRVGDLMVTNVLPSDIAHGVIGVSVYSYFYGHAISTWGADDYINGLLLPGDPSQSGEGPTEVVGMGSFHPTAAGALHGEAQAVTDELAQL
jgi:hypothetical protein